MYVPRLLSSIYRVLSVATGVNLILPPALVIVILASYAGHNSYNREPIKFMLNDQYHI